MGWDGMGWDGMGWDGMGWDGIGYLQVCRSIEHLAVLITNLLIPIPSNADKATYPKWLIFYREVCLCFDLLWLPDYISLKGRLDLTMSSQTCRILICALIDWVYVWQIEFPTRGLLVSLLSPISRPWYHTAVIAVCSSAPLTSCIVVVRTGII